jgi:ribosomal protein S21
MSWCLMTLDVSLHQGETQDAMLRRFLRVVQMDGVLHEARARRFFVSNGDAARIKRQKNARRRRLGRDKR